MVNNGNRGLGLESGLFFFRVINKFAYKFMINTITFVRLQRLKWLVVWQARISY